MNCLFYNDCSTKYNSLTKISHAGTDGGVSGSYCEEKPGYLEKNHLSYLMAIPVHVPTLGIEPGSHLVRGPSVNH